MNGSDEFDREPESQEAPVPLRFLTPAEVKARARGNRILAFALGALGLLMLLVTVARLSAIAKGVGA